MNKKICHLLLVLSVAASSNAQMQNGNTCSQAKETSGIPDSCTVNEHQLNAGEMEQWHKIMPAEQELKVRVEKPLDENLEEAHIHKIKLYKGGCGSLMLIEEKNVSMNEELKIERTDLAINEEHFIKLERDPNCWQCSAQGGAFYGLCVQKNITIIDTNLYIYAEIFRDTIVSIVWDKHPDGSIVQYTVEKSLDGIYFTDTASTSTDNLWDIMLTPPSSSFEGIMYTTEYGQRFIYNEINNNFNQLFKLHYRIRMNTNLNKTIYSKIFKPLIFKTITPDVRPILLPTSCPIILNPPNGWVTTDPVITYTTVISDNSSCCVVTYTWFSSPAPTSSCIKNSCFYEIGDCLCWCTIDPCCQHYCSSSNAGLSYTDCGCKPWNPCNGDGTQAGWFVTNVTDVGNGNIIPQNPMVCEGECVSLTFNTNIPQLLDDPFQFFWSPNGEITPSITVCSSATSSYDLFIYNAMCFLEYSTTITVNPKPTVTASASEPVICSGKTTTLTATATGGITPYTYQWSNGLGSGTTQTVSPTANTIYTVTVAGSNGCTGTASVTVSVNQSPTITVIASPSPICNGQSSTLTAAATGGTTPYNYLWSNNLGSGTTKTVAPTATTTYSVTVTGNNICTSTASTTVIVNQPPSVSITPSSSTICSGNNSTLTASGGSAYLWSTGATTSAITVTSTATTLYTVTVTGSNNCAATATATVTVIPSPVITFTANGTCAGQNTGYAIANVTNGAPPYSYLWSTGETSEDIYDLFAGTYTVTVTGSNNCTATATATVSEFPMPEAPLIIGNNNACDLISDYTVANPIAGATYEWTTTQGTILNCSQQPCTTQTVTAQWGQNVTAQITLTVTDNNGCTNSATLIVFRCCTGIAPSTAIPLTNINCAPTNTYTGQEFLIHGNYIICTGNTVTFDGCSLYFAPDARITVSSEATLQCINGSVLRASCGFMWDGIYLASSDSKLLIEKSRIYDARNAVVSKNKGIYDVHNSFFDLNLKSVVQQYDANTPEIIKGNQFLSSGTLLPYLGPNLNIPTITAPRSIAHIELTDVQGTGITVGNASAGNIFKNADNGIVCTNSKLTSVKNSFSNFETANNNASIGNCIYATGSELIIGGNAASANTFIACTTGTGIYSVLPQNTTITNCTLNTVHSGIKLLDPASKKNLQILSNTFNGYKYAIEVRNMAACTLKINNNTLNQNNSFGNTYAYHAGTGIKVHNNGLFFSKQVPQPEIKNNNIDGNIGSYTDIHTILVRNALIKGNTITKKRTNSIIASAANVIYYGIKAEGCANAQISNNTITRPSGAAPVSTMNTVAQKLYGISIQNSAGNTVAQNKVERMGSGVHATGACHPANLYCNMLNYNYNGFYLNNASIGNQGVAPFTFWGFYIPGVTSDNVWTDLPGNVGDRILYQIPLTNPLTNWHYRTTAFNGFSASAFNPNNGTGIGIQFPLLGQLQALPSSGIPGCNIQLKNFTPEEREGVFGGIVRSEKTFGNHEPEFKIHEKEMAFRELKEEGWLNLSSPDDALFQNFVDSIHLTNTGKLYDVRIAIEQNDLVLSENKNTAIISEHLIEENQKTVNSIYIKAAQENRTEFDAAETVTLESIACQDPLEGGDAVYSANVMLRKETTCQQQARMANPDVHYENDSSQNLVKNNSFEQYYMCPDTNGQIYHVKNWFEVGPSSCFPDYFNVCGSGQAGVPNNFVGYQQTQGGSGYIGFVPYVKAPSITNAREFAEGELNAPLESGKIYCVELYVSLTLNPFCKYAINSIGCFLSADTFYRVDCQQEVFVIPQIENTDSIITDTMNWVLISGEFTAIGGEKFLTVGNFRNDSNTEILLLGDTSINNYGNAYYYIDNVSITQCDVSVTEKTPNGNWQMAVYPNPASNNITVTAEGGDAIIITDVTGRKIKEYKLSTNQLKINTVQYENGIYFIALYNGQRLVAAEKLCVAK